jgi:5-bromo-4-chloroindolyl phosphate hydrolysis protein
MIVMFMTFGKMCVWSVRAAWGITKALVTVVFFPIVLILMACSGLIGIALVIALICGAVAWIGSAAS